MDQKLQIADLLGRLYFMGGPDGCILNFDLENSIVADLPRLAPDVFRTEAERCGKELQARGAAESAMGRDLQQCGAKMEQEENSR